MDQEPLDDQTGEDKEQEEEEEEETTADDETRKVDGAEEPPAYGVQGDGGDKAVLEAAKEEVCSFCLWRAVDLCARNLSNRTRSFFINYSCCGDPQVSLVVVVLKRFLRVFGCLEKFCGVVTRVRLEIRLNYGVRLP